MPQSTPSASLSLQSFAQGEILIRNTGETRTGTLQAFVRGVPLGQAVAFDPTAAVFSVPCQQFPHVSLPAELRIGWDDGTDAIAVVQIDSLSDINTLVGHGVLTDVQAVFRNGLISGTARNAFNGVDTPMLVGRVNGSLLRTVETSIYGGHEEGGAVIRFAMPVEASDFSDRGATFELLHAPALTCAWRSVLAPADTLMAGGIETDVRLSESERKLADAFARTEIKLTTQIARQNNLIEDVTAYLLALINDHANGQTGEDKTRQLAQTLIAKAAAANIVESDTNSAVVGPLSPYMGWGWNDAALNKDRIETRRMGAAATVLNPHTDRMLQAIAVTVIDASNEAISHISAQIDGHEAFVDLSGATGAPCTILVRPKIAGSGSLLSLSCTRPGQGIHVQDFRFFYG